MNSFKLAIKPSAAKELDRLDKTLFARVDAKIRALAESPRPAGCRKLQGYTDYWRIRVGDYRVIYTVDDIHHRIDIIRVAHRREVYET